MRAVPFSVSVTRIARAASDPGGICAGRDANDGVGRTRGGGVEPAGTTLSGGDDRAGAVPFNALDGGGIGLIAAGGRGIGDLRGKEASGAGRTVSFWDSFGSAMGGLTIGVAILPETVPIVTDQVTRRTTLSGEQVVSADSANSPEYEPTRLRRLGKDHAGIHIRRICLSPRN